MEKKYRALGTLAGLFKVIAWLVLAAGIVATIVTGALGVLASRRGVSELFANVPFVNQISGLVPAILGAVGMLIAALLLFLYVLAISEAIQVAISIERNTRETAMYLRGEGQLPTLPVATSWEGEDTRA